MLNASVDINERIKRRDRRPGSESGLHKAGCSGSGATRSTGRAACSSAGSTCPKTTDTTTGSALYYTSVDATEEASGLRSHDVGVRDGQVVTSNRQIKIVLQRQVNSVLQRQKELALANHLVEAR